MALAAMGSHLTALSSIALRQIVPYLSLGMFPLTVLNGDYSRGYHNPFFRTVSIRGNIPIYPHESMSRGGASAEAKSSAIQLLGAT